MQVVTKLRLREGQVVQTATASQQDMASSSAKARMGRGSTEFRVPTQFSMQDWHPDLEALLALLVYGPFAVTDMHVSRGVSAAFADAVINSLNIRVSPVDLTLSPRRLPTAGRDALAYSGGVDSTAALALLPEDTIPIFMHRVPLPGGARGLYRPDAALQSCTDVQTSGYHAEIVDTTMEYAREPIGFAVDWTNASGAILLADHLGLRSVSFGMVAESAFHIGHPRFSELARRSVYAGWAPLFERVGVPISLPTSGLSEVMTSKIATEQAFRWSSQSCIRGTAEQPCMNCFKCFRKGILEARIFDQPVDPSHFDIALNSAEVKRRLLEQPIHHEDVLAFSVHGLRCDGHPVLAALQRKTEALLDYSDGVCFAESIYPGFSRYVPDFIVDHVTNRLSEYASMASEHAIGIFEGWDTMSLCGEPSYREGQSQLERLLGGSGDVRRSMAMNPATGPSREAPEYVVRPAGASSSHESDVEDLTPEVERLIESNEPLARRVAQMEARTAALIQEVERREAIHVEETVALTRLCERVTPEGIHLGSLIAENAVRLRLRDLLISRLRARRWVFPGMTTMDPESRAQVRLVSQSPAFDSEWYLNAYPDVRAAGQDPALHFVMNGFYEGRKPNRDFDPVSYYATHPELLDAGVDPLLTVKRSETIANDET